MSTPPTDAPAVAPQADPLKPPQVSTPDGKPAPPIVEKPTGWRAAFEHTGIPQSWLRRPKMPSKKVMVFVSTVSGLLGTYYYDRQQCKLIRQSYIDKVKHLSQEPMRPWELPRKVTVYACKWPGDDQHDRSAKWFRTYVKPILVAAAVDYELKNGNQHGGLAQRIAEDIRDRRRIELGIDPAPEERPPPGPPQPKDHKRRREMAGGIILIGRHTFKEYMEGLKRGWSMSLAKMDGDDALSKELENDGHFDELAPPENDSAESESKATPPSPAAQSPIIFSPMQLKMPPPSKPPPPPAQPRIPPHLDVPPVQIPQQPPLTLVPYTSLLGFLNIPFMIYGYFNHRKDVRIGAEAAYRVIVNETRPFNEPASDSQSLDQDSSSREDGGSSQIGDLAFDLSCESNFRSNYDDTPENIAKSRKSYYEALAKKLETARALARREREPTKDETKFPPPTEVELRAERLKKEKKWRNELDGYEILNKHKGVSWDEKMRGALTVTVEGELPPPPPSTRDQEDS
ncbi:mitochondrial import inner membrane translocase subunit tim54 [Tulasnella sp. JGI-2019a]|nr:mitochondrial import inner membrane translocase subunit tim54 [Tulasnella sp. JGI-2019a]KAG9012014.1 mitochondrial import inner membrane translocase subunit tim54 [Tulasnella sp. JGI-2019a]